MSTELLYLTVFQVVILGTFLFVLKMVIRPSNPKGGYMTVEYCNEKMDRMENKIFCEIKELKESVRELNAKVDRLLISLASCAESRVHEGKL